MYTLLIGGMAGNGIETTAGILEKLLKRAGAHAYVLSDAISRLGGSQDYSIIGFGSEYIMTRHDWLDGIVALSGEAIERYGNRLKSNGFIICDSSLQCGDPRAVTIDIGEIAREIGNIHVSGSAAIGIILKLFGLKLLQAAEVLKAFIIGQYVDVNLKALTAGYNAAFRRYELIPEDGMDGKPSGGGAHMTATLAAILRLASSTVPSPTVMPDATQYPDRIKPTQQLSTAEPFYIDHSLPDLPA